MRRRRDAEAQRTPLRLCVERNNSRNSSTNTEIMDLQRICHASFDNLWLDFLVMISHISQSASLIPGEGNVHHGILDLSFSSR